MAKEESAEPTKPEPKKHMHGGPLTGARTEINSASPHGVEHHPGHHVPEAPPEPEKPAK